MQSSSSLGGDPNAFPTGYRPFPNGGGNDEEHDYETESTGSEMSVIEPPKPFLRSLRSLAVLMAVMTLAEIVVCSIYSYISGYADYYYAHKHSWQFCILYTGATIQAWDQKIIDSVSTILANLGLQTCIFGWLALAATFRALYHYEWIPATIAFLVMNLFGQLIYYQATPLILVESTEVTSLVAVTKWVSKDMYKDMGKWCFTFFFSLTDDPVVWNVYPPYEQYTTQQYPGNCTESVVLLTPDIADIENAQEQLVAIANSSTPDSDLNCDGALNLNYTFLCINYFFCCITFGLLLVLIRAEKYRQDERKQRYWIHETHEYLSGTVWPKVLIFVSVVGYFMTSCAKLDSALVALDSTQEWPLIESQAIGATHVDFLGTELPIQYKYSMNFYVNGWLPFKKNYIDIQTIFLIGTVMSVIRGDTKQSTSAFRLASVSSLLYVITTWPIMVGNLQTFNANDLWWWDSDTKCANYFTGKMYLYPDDDQSARLCTDTRVAMLGALFTFIAMHLCCISSLLVFYVNIERKSLAEGAYAEGYHDGAAMGNSEDSLNNADWTQPDKVSFGKRSDIQTTSEI